MMNYLFLNRIGVVFGLFLIMAGCASTAPTRFYSLNPMASTETASKAASADHDLAIGVGPVKIPDYLNRPHIVTRTGQNQLTLSEFDKWAGSLQSDVSRVIAENLSVLLSSGSVYVYPSRSYIPLKYQVEVNIIRFEGVVGGDVSLAASWSILEVKEKEIILTDKASFREKTDGMDYVSLVAAKSRLLANLSRVIVESVHGIK
jgi:uncharacterized lipoprotein YmbA